MDTQVKEFIVIVFQIMLIGVLATFLAYTSRVGKAYLNEYIAQKDAKDIFPPIVAYTKGSVGYYELVDLVEDYGSSVDVIVRYRNTEGGYSTMRFTTAIDGKVVRIVLGDEDATGVVYSREAGKIYRNGIQVTTTELEMDMKIKLGSLQALGEVQGNGVLEYRFLEVLFEWLKDERFVCTVEQLKESEELESITLEMQN